MAAPQPGRAQPGSVAWGLHSSHGGTKPRGLGEDAGWRLLLHGQLPAHGHVITRLQAWDSEPGVRLGLGLWGSGPQPAPAGT